MFDQIRTEVFVVFDRIVGLDFTELLVDGSLQESPCCGEGTGPNPTERMKLGWKWSVGVDARGVPIGRARDGANHNDAKLLEPSPRSIVAPGLLIGVDTDAPRSQLDSPKIRRE